MFDEKQIEQYRSVKASAGLKESVMSLEKSGKVYAFNRRTVSAVAACLVAVIAIGTYLSYGSMDVQIQQLPYQTAAYYRSADEKVLIELSVNGEYEVTVSDGSFIVNGESVTSAQFNGEAAFEWFVGLDGENILTVKKGLITRQYRLCFDEEVQSWVLE